MRRQIHVSNVGSVDAKASGDFDESVDQLLPVQFARVSILRGEFGQLATQRSHLHAKKRVHDEFLLLVHQVGKVLLPTGECRKYLLHAGCALGLDKYSVGFVQIVIAGGSAHRPVLQQSFMPRKDLLDQHVRRRSLAAVVGSQSLLQSVQIGQRIAKAVDVVDAQSGGGAFRDEAQDVTVSRLKHEGIFHPYADEISDREESAVVDAFVQILPKRQFVVLLCEQPLNKTKTSRIAFLAIDVRYAVLDQLCDFLAAGNQRSQSITRRLKSQSLVGGVFRCLPIRVGEFANRR